MCTPWVVCARVALLRCSLCLFPLCSLPSPPLPPRCLPFGGLCDVSSSIGYTCWLACSCSLLCVEVGGLRGRQGNCATMRQVTRTAEVITEGVGGRGEEGKRNKARKHCVLVVFHRRLFMRSCA
uniref:Secreted protein n=1 Tax=Leishmania guyanensis TaxID=5670 RepID=A0A1E1IR63_LEIGU|nr:Hypothetical protein BN36_1112080 [Leishmania guyanensis]